MMIRILLFLSTVAILAGCKKEASTNSTATSVPQTITTPQGFGTSGIDQDNLKMLMNTADHIDYMFNDIPLSMNQDGQQAVLQDLSLISTDPIDGIPSGCTPLARKIYFSNGEIIMEGDLYFSQECIFQVFIKDEKPLFGNQLTTQGIAFYNNLMEQADATMPDDVRREQNLNRGN